MTNQYTAKITRASAFLNARYYISYWENGVPVERTMRGLRYAYTLWGARRLAKAGLGGLRRDNQSLNKVVETIV